MCKVIVVTSGKGGVGKTTTSASIATGLALKGKKTCAIDFDIGLRNLDLIMGAERRVVYDFVQLIQKRDTIRLNQALVKDKNVDNLYILAASQTDDKDALTKEGVESVLNELKQEGFEYIICDSPAGIEHGAFMAFYFADEAIITVNPEVSSVRDSDRMIGIIQGKSRRSELGLEPMKEYLVINRYNPKRVENDEMMSIDRVLDIISLPLLGVIPEDEGVLEASNQGKAVILNQDSHAGQAYSDLIERLLGRTDLPFRFLDAEKGFWKKIFGK